MGPVERKPVNLLGFRADKSDIPFADPVKLETGCI